MNYSFNNKRIQQLCQQYHVAQLALFGSALTDQFNDQSDVDFVVRFESFDIMYYASNYFELKEKLEALFNRSVDLVEEQAIRNPIFSKEVNQTKQIIYDKGNK